MNQGEAGRAAAGPVRGDRKMTIEHLMTRDVETCAPEDDLARAAMIMWRRDCGFVPVVDPVQGRCVGVITDRDICVAGATKHRPLHGILVREVMSPGVYTCATKDNVLVALHRMAEGQVRRLPVVSKEGRVEGVLSLNDLILAAERMERKREDAVTYADVISVLKAVSAHRLPILVGTPG
jgi:CBS domain-containing protein